MADDFTGRYGDLINGSYDCVDRVVLNAFFPVGHNPGGFRSWWRRLHGGSDDQRARMSQPLAATSTPELVAAQLPERLRSGYAGLRGDDGPHRGKPLRRDRPLRRGERVHDPQSRRCGISAISESEAMSPELPEERSTTRSSWTSRTTTRGGAGRGALVPAVADVDADQLLAAP